MLTREWKANKKCSTNHYTTLLLRLIHHAQTFAKTNLKNFFIEYFSQKFLGSIIVMITKFEWISIFTITLPVFIFDKRWFYTRYNKYSNKAAELNRNCIISWQNFEAKIRTKKEKNLIFWKENPRLRNFTPPFRQSFRPLWISLRKGN